MAKFAIPRFRYLAQDESGAVWLFTKEPEAEDIEGWLGGGSYKMMSAGKENSNWRDTLIDLDVDDYEFENGILRRIER